MIESKSLMKEMPALIQCWQPKLLLRLLHCSGDWSSRYDLFSAGSVTPESTVQLELRLETILREFGRRILQHTLNGLEAEAATRTLAATDDCVPVLRYVTDAGFHPQACFRKVLSPMKHPRTGRNLTGAPQCGPVETTARVPRDPVRLRDGDGVSEEVSQCSAVTQMTAPKPVEYLDGNAILI